MEFLDSVMKDRECLDCSVGFAVSRTRVGATLTTHTVALCYLVAYACMCTVDALVVLSNRSQQCSSKNKDPIHFSHREFDY